MKTITTLLCILLVGLGLPAYAQEPALFKRLVGNWTFESEAVMAPGQPKMKGKGTERVRAIGSFWVVLEAKLSVQNMPMDTLMTIGAPKADRTLEGSWISSMSGMLITYKGTISKDGNTVELVTEMPNPAKGGKKSKFKDVISLQGNDARTLKSSVLEDNGKWVEYLSATYKRVRG